MAETREQRAQMARRKKAQEIISATTATLGLSALAAKGGAAGVRQAIKHSPKAAKLSYLPKAAERMDKATVPILTTGAGIGGAGGFNFAAIQREEARREREKFRRAPVAKKELSRTDKQAIAGTTSLGGAYGAVTLAALGGTPSQLKRKPAKPTRVGGRVFDFGDRGGAAYRMSERFQRKAEAEPTLKTKDPNVKSKYEKIKTSAAQETTQEARDAFSNKAKSFETKYGMTGGAKWHHKMGAKALGTPNKAAAAMYTGAVLAGAGAGAGSGYLAAKARQRRAAQPRKSDAVSKSAFGVVEKVYDPEKARHSRLKGYQAAAAGGAATTGVAGGALLAGKAAPYVQSKASTAAFDASKTGKTKTASAMHRVSGGASKVGQIASKVPHKGKAGAALVGTSVALGVTHNRLKAHRKGSGRSYTDWWDG